MSQKLLAQVLRRFPRTTDGKLLVDASTADDAGVYRLSSDCALVQTVDFFTPIVDDPFVYGQIAAANAMSDVYAMGGRPITALNLLAVPAEKLPAKVIARILRGGESKVLEAKCVVVGGHTVENSQPLYGLAVTGVVHPRRMITNAAARVGDVLILTKPLGTGIVATGLKRSIASAKLVRQATQSMLRLNTVGHELASRGLVRAGTDVTGFGLLGHLGTLCRASRVSARIEMARIPVFSPEVLELIQGGCVPGGTRANLEGANATVRFINVEEDLKILLADAQTSGGLLLCVRPRKVEQVIKLLEAHRAPAQAIIGAIVAGKGIVVRA